MNELPPFQRHSATSREAALSVYDSATTMRQRVLQFIGSCGAEGATDEEIQDGLGMNPSTERPRRIELLGAGRIEGNGTRLTRSQRKAVVWRLVQKEPTQGVLL